MPINIVDGGDLRISSVIATLYGPPGIGKTTYALTANNPLLLDFDRGAHRADGRHGKAVAPVAQWQDVSGLKPADLDGYDTIIVDTIGTLLDSLAANIVAKDSKMGYAGNLNLQGYGKLKADFARWLGFLRSIGKDIVFLAHCTEQRQPDGSTVDRIKAVGASRDEVYQQSDIIGRLSINGKDRVVSFDPTEHSYAKNCGLPDQLVLPPADACDALGVLLTEAKERIGHEPAAQAANIMAPQSVPSLSLRQSARPTLGNVYRSASWTKGCHGRTLRPKCSARHKRNT